MANETAEQLRAEAAQHDADAEASFQRCDTDGFLSQWASGLTAREKRLQADIVEAGGKAEFTGLFDRETGDRVKAKIVHVTGYGGYGKVAKWLVLGANDEALAWVAAYKTGKRSKLYQMGFEERREMAAAKADIGGSGKGLSGAASCFVYARRLDGGYPADAVVWKGA